MLKSEPQEDLDRLLNEYDISPSNGMKWAKDNREPGCSKKALRRGFIFTFLCLLAVGVGWFLHVNVFMDNPLPTPVTMQKSIISDFSENVGSVDWLNMIIKSGIFERIDTTTIIDYGISHLPPSLIARLLLHSDDVKKGDVFKLLEDSQLMDEIFDFLKIPQDLPGSKKIEETVDDYDYNDRVIPKHNSTPTQDRQTGLPGSPKNIRLEEILGKEKG
uniref:Uncharacterized protein n=1 Tax=Strigamia maritima TaxID=126957 RepID=T1IMA2_STRMM